MERKWLMDWLIVIIVLVGFMFAGTFVLGAIRVLTHWKYDSDLARRAGYDLKAWRTGELATENISQLERSEYRQSLDIVATKDGFDIKAIRQPRFRGDRVSSFRAPIL